MRKEISLVAGPRGWGDTRASWLAKVPREVRRALGTASETVSYRTVKSLWYGQISNPEHSAARDVRRAAEIIRARKDALSLAEKYQTLAGSMRGTDENFYSADIARLERVARLLCGGDRAG